MGKHRIIDSEYKAYIEQLPCYICGHIPVGNRSIYNEYADEWKEYPCKNNAHHCDKDMTRAKNDHKLIPVCAHYIISGKNTNNCHEKVHSEAQYKTKEKIEEFNEAADKYYEEYLNAK